MVTVVELATLAILVVLGLLAYNYKGKSLKR